MRLESGRTCRVLCGGQEAKSWFLAAGYAVVSIDVRGTGASFGRWRAPWTPEERTDSREVVDWASRQPWSNGQARPLRTRSCAQSRCTSAGVPADALLSSAATRRHRDFLCWHLPLPSFTCLSMMLLLLLLLLLGQRSPMPIHGAAASRNPNQVPARCLAHRRWTSQHACAGTWPCALH